MTATITRSPMEAPFTAPVFCVRPYPLGMGWWVTKNDVPINWFGTWARAINEARSRNAAVHLRAKCCTERLGGLL